MWQTILRIGIGILLIIHGFAHWQITTGWGAKTAISSWLLPNLDAGTLASLGNFFWVAALLVFVAAGIVLFFGIDWWRSLTIVAALLSLLVIAIFWQPNMIFGAAVDIGVMIALLWGQWPTPQWLGV